jgi:integrase/recombinase XerD
MTKIYKADKELLEFTEKFPEGQQMLRKAAKAINSKLAYARACKLFCDFLHKTPTEIVNEYKTDIQQNQYKAYEKWEETFENFVAYLETSGYKGGSLSLFHSGAKALINSNVPRSLRLQAKTPTYYSKTIRGVTIDDLKEIWSVCGVREKVFIAVLKDSGISAADVIRLNVGDLEGFEKGEQWIHIWMVREKEHVEYETFIGPNAVEVLKAYMTIRKQRGETITGNSAVFVKDCKPYERIDSETLRQAFANMQNRTSKKISTHRLRKFFETYMALVVRHPIILKFWMGHKVRKRDVEARYIIPPTLEQLELYKEAYKTIDLEPKPEHDELLKAEIKARMESLTADERKRFFAEMTTLYGHRAKRWMTEKDFRDLIEQPDTNPDGAGLGEQFEQINEANLLQYLKAGWSIVKELQSGEVIVKR